jgi:hypothetical protein
MEPERIPAFEEVEPEVRREWIAARRIEGKRKLYEAIRARYQVILPELSAGETSAPGERP